MNRYPGPRSFTGDDRHLFFGRDLEKQELFRLIVLNDLVVLFGESGTGKTSLLQAGVCPALEARQFKPVFIRLNNIAEPPELQVCRQLREGGFIPADMPEGRTLWEYFSRFWYVDLGEVFTPVFIFDQFEELFTLYKPDERKEFIKQFADITNHRPPPGLPPEAAAPPQAKFIFSIRSDFLYLLDELSADIPSILRCRFQLRLLGREQAADAIIRPAGVEGAYVSPKFSYSPAALSGILEALGRHDTEGRLAADHPTATLEIAAFQLQLVCRQLEARIIQEQKPEGFAVEPDFYGGRAGIRNIIDEFYNTVIEKVPAAEREAAERLLARGLIRNGRRIMMEESAMREEYGLSQATLAQLHEERLLKREARKGELYYEISHDTLVKPVLERFKKIEEAERERKAREEEERLRREREKIRRARLRNIIVGMVALALLGFAFWRNSVALEALKSADEQQQIAEAAKVKAADEQQKAKQAEEQAAKEQQKAKEAKIAADEATEEAKRQQRIAELEKDKARTAREEAELAELNAQSAQARADSAQTRAALAEKEVAEKTKALVQKLLREAPENIYELRYEAALENIRDAMSLGEEKPAVARTALELAFWHGESGQIQLAAGLLDSAALLANNTAVRNLLKGLPRDSAAARQKLRDAVRLFDERAFDSLMMRYYPVMMDVRGGTFTMGCDTLRDNGCGSNEKPPHAVTLSSFQLAQTETTVWQYGLYCAATGRDSIQRTKVSTWSLDGNTPVINVSWYDAARYANWVSRQLGKDTAYAFVRQIGENDWEVKLNPNAKEAFRLPTEAEWEYAARGGLQQDTFIYSGSNELEEVAWYYQNADRTMPAATRKANGLGLFDMSGNVWEWCQDWYGSYEEEAQVDPIGPESGSNRVLRGGSWSNNPADVRCAGRVSYTPDGRRSYIGFRLARPVE